MVSIYNKTIEIEQVHKVHAKLYESGYTRLHRDWHSIKNTVIREILHHKTDYFPQFKQAILDSVGSRLVVSLNDLRQVPTQSFIQAVMNGVMYWIGAVRLDERSDTKYNNNFNGPSCLITLCVYNEKIYTHY